MLGPSRPYFSHLNFVIFLWHLRGLLNPLSFLFCLLSLSWTQGVTVAYSFLHHRTTRFTRLALLGCPCCTCCLSQCDMDRLRFMLSELRQRADAVFEWPYHSARRRVRTITKQWPSAWLSTWSIGRLPLLRHDSEPMNSFDRDAWRRRRKTTAEQIVHLCWVSLTYLLSEAIIWGLSRALAPVKIEFFSSIISMLLVFICMGAAYVAWRPMEAVYRRWIKPRVCRDRPGVILAS
jgi:hypothetical protein